MATTISSADCTILSPAILLFMKCVKATVLDEIILADTPRHREVRKGGDLLERTLNSDESFRTKVQQHIGGLVASIRGIVLKCMVKNSIVWQRVWPAFDEFRQGILIEHWDAISDHLGVEFDSILIQATSEKLLMGIAKAAVNHDAPSTDTIKSRRNYTFTEQCAIMYCGGYVVKKLLDKFCRCRGDKEATFVEALKSMCSTDFDDGDYGDFNEGLKKWMNDVNRGGLKVLSEFALDFFNLIEEIVYNGIEHQVKEKLEVQSRAMYEDIRSNSDVQFLWTIICVDLRTEAESDELLECVVELWIRIRGHSIAAVITERFKRESATQTKGIKAIRKNLQSQFASKFMVYHV
jgi:hypothetical protein